MVSPPFPHPQQSEKLGELNISNVFERNPGTITPDIDASDLLIINRDITKSTSDVNVPTQTLRIKERSWNYCNKKIMHKFR